MTAVSEARRIALMLNDSKWQEIEEEIRKAIEAGVIRGKALRGFHDTTEDLDGRADGQPDIAFPLDIPGWMAPELWRDQPDGVR